MFPTISMAGAKRVDAVDPGGWETEPVSGLKFRRLKNDLVRGAERRQRLALAQTVRVPLKNGDDAEPRDDKRTDGDVNKEYIVSVKTLRVLAASGSVVAA